MNKTLVYLSIFLLIGSPIWTEESSEPQIIEMSEDERAAFHEALDEVLNESELELNALLEEMQQAPFDTGLYLHFINLSQSFQVKWFLAEKFRNSPRMNHPENRESLINLLNEEVIEAEDIKNFEAELDSREP